MKKAFSLIELLISLIIISLITSALAPILTRKIRKTDISIGAKSVSANCSNLDNDDRCMMCTKTTCTLCITQTSIPEGYYVNPEESCDYKECKDKFVGCKACNKDFCVTCEDGYSYNAESKTCIKCPDNCSVCSSSNNCTKCNEGYSETNGKCTKKGGDCYTVAYSKICIAKFNAGDPGGLEIPEGLVTIIPTATATDAGPHTQAICWRGDTANQGKCDAANGGYSGCHRTVCTWYAADKICKHHGWRLPTNDEMASFFAYSKDKGVDGLQLCDDAVGYSSAGCTRAGGSCPQSHNGKCHPHGVWSAKAVSNISMYRYNLASGVWSGPMEGYASYALSVRCVKDL